MEANENYDKEFSDSSDKNYLEHLPDNDNFSEEITPD
jgi:hypothetical protein